MDAETLRGAPGVQRNGSHRRRIVDRQVGDFALCITPASKFENRVVMVISEPLDHPDKPDIVYWIHPGLPDSDNWGWGPQ